MHAFLRSNRRTTYSHPGERTGPGGVLVFTADGKHLGTVATGVPTANCGWGNDGSVLYVTADKQLCRIKTLTKGKGF